MPRAKETFLHAILGTCAIGSPALTYTFCLYLLPSNTKNTTNKNRFFKTQGCKFSTQTLLTMHDGLCHVLQHFWR